MTLKDKNKLTQYLPASLWLNAFTLNFDQFAQTKIQYIAYTCSSNKMDFC